MRVSIVIPTSRFTCTYVLISSIRQIAQEYDPRTMGEKGLKKS